MLLITIVFVFLMNNKERVFGVLVSELEPCGDDHSLYLLEGQVVKWAKSVQGHAWIEGCINDTEVIAEFDLDLIVQYGYYQLFIDNAIWPSIPQTAKCKEVLMRGVTAIGVWGGCSELENLEIYSPMNLSLISPDWLSNCKNLNRMLLHDLDVAQIRTVLDTVQKVINVDLRILHIEDILLNPIFPTERGGHLWMRTLNFFIPSDTMDNKDISWEAVSESFVYQLSLLPRLEEIYVSRFENLDWCVSVNYSSVTFGALKNLLLTNTATSDMCFRTLRVNKNLTRLAIPVGTVKFGDMLSTCAAQIHVGYLDSVLFYRDDYLFLSDCNVTKKGNVTLDLNQFTLYCDCSHSLWFTRAMLEGFVTAPGLTCSDGSTLEDQSCDWLNCNRVRCNTKCVCCDDTNNGIVADCRDASLTDIPGDVLSLNNITELLIPNSNISVLPSHFPESLIFLDLTGNDLLKDLDASQMSSLLAVPGRIVRLAFNPIICSCDNQLLIEVLQQHSSQIEDYHAMVCAGEKRSLHEVNVALLCEAQDQAANKLVSVIVALVAAILGLILGVMWYYRQQIKVFLFARGWCLCCINEEELDADRRYDIFLSYCHFDENIVVDELLPILDQEYSVCVHFRDWNPGDMIPSQIWRSVEQSRRTIVVLSRNFIKSLWGLLEFRSAYVSGLTEGRHRVVMVILDDVLKEENLEGELNAYVKLNTYVKWGDPWFWHKLRFALPHHPALSKSQHRNTDTNSASCKYFVDEQQVEIKPSIGQQNGAVDNPAYSSDGNQSS